MLKPLIFLDVDDTIISYGLPINIPGRYLDRNFPQPATKAKEFIIWLSEHCEVRWLTAWCPSGRLKDSGKERLANILDVDKSIFDSFDNPHMWMEYKTEAIPFHELKNGNREWFWIEDGLLQKEIKELQDRNELHRYIKCNVTEDKDALEHTWKNLSKALKIDI